MPRARALAGRVAGRGKYGVKGGSKGHGSRATMLATTTLQPELSDETSVSASRLPISGGITLAAYPVFIEALAAVKEAAATANRDLGLLPAATADAIIAACQEIRNGALHSHFVVDVIQGGAGTSTNMNANEVIANRALEIVGCRRGVYQHLHPLEHVNLSQSTNDVYPTAIKLALDTYIDWLLDALDALRIALSGKATEFVDAVKLGRTQLQDAVPMTPGQEFAASPSRWPLKAASCG